MVRLAPLLLSFGLAAGKTVELTTSSVSPPAHGRTVRFPTQPASQQTLQQLHQKAYHVLPVAKQGHPVLLPASIERDGSQHHSDSSYSQSSGGYSDGGYSQSSGGYSQPSGGYTQPSYGGYSGDSYGYTEATTYEDGRGGFLGGIGKYGFIIIPILLGIGLLFLFPSVLNISSARNNRALRDEGDISDDLIYRLMSIYSSISEEPLCVNRMFCEIGSAVGNTPYANRTMQYIDYFYPSKSDNMLVMKKAAQAKEPHCHLLECSAWEDKPTVAKRQSSQARKNKEKIDAQRQRT